MRVLVDKDILKWNQRLYNSTYMISADQFNAHVYLNKTSQNLIIMRREYVGSSKSQKEFSNFALNEVDDPTIKYDFVFSVSDNRKDELFRIHESLLESGVLNNKSYKDKHSEIITAPDIVNSKFESHEIFNRKYTRYSYHLEGKLTSIVAYLTILEDSIEFFQKIWGYDESGNEHPLLKYPIGTIVSKIEDKSKDYMVMDYQYDISYNLGYDISLIISEIDNDPKSLIIRYKEPIFSSEKNLTHSRNSRIDNILN